MQSIDTNPTHTHFFHLSGVNAAFGLFSRLMIHLSYFAPNVLLLLQLISSFKKIFDRFEHPFHFQLTLFNISSMFTCLNNCSFAYYLGFYCVLHKYYTYYSLWLRGDRPVATTEGKKMPCYLDISYVVFVYYTSYICIS